MKNNPSTKPERCLSLPPLRTMFQVFLSLLLLGLIPSGAFSHEKSKANSATRIDLNRATLQELTSLPGIGIVTARRIIEFREKNGPFRRVEEVLIIRGISKKKFQQLLQRISVEGESGKRNTIISKEKQ
jgi:competence ComEA-like helix-hairpin-helix protein